MTENSILIETSFADAIAIIAASRELPEQTRRHWPTSMLQIAKALDKPIEVIPARYGAVRADLAQLHQVPAGLTAKTLQNHKSNTKSALLWLEREKGIPKHGAPLTAAWEELRAKVKDGVARSRLSSLMRYCSANNIPPADVDEAALERFVSYRSRCCKPADDAFRRLLARAWNANVGTTPGWPAQRLTEPPVKAAVEIEWDAFPEGLRRDVDRYLQGLTRIRKSRTGQRIRPLKESTIRTRRAEFQAAARTAVKTGVPITKLDSLSALLAPDVAEKVLDAYWQKNGENPKLFTIDLACRFLAIAKETKCLSDAECERLDEMRRDFEDHRQEGLTDKNIAFLRQVLISELNVRVRSVTVWNCIYKLRRAAELLTPRTDYFWLAEIEKDLALVMEPRTKFDRLVFTERLVEAGLTLIEEAQRYAKNDVDRARRIRNGLIISLLALLPIRIKNFAALEIGRTFKQVQDSWWIALPTLSTKTTRLDERRVPEILTRAIDMYLSQSRPVLLGSKAPTDFLWISSRTGRRITTKNLGTLISKITYRTLGVDVSPHLFRTAAATTAAMYGGNIPNLASAVLGHTDPRVTEEHYNRATSIEAAKTYAAIIRQYMSS